MDSYWSRLLGSRITRRRALQATGAAGAALFLAACATEDLTKEVDVSGDYLPLNGREVDTTAQAKRGGVFKAALLRAPRTFDLHQPDAFTEPFNPLVGSKLAYIRPARMREPDRLDVAPDLASWEITPDRLTYTFRLSPQAKFAPLSPTFHQGAPQSIANRAVDSRDVLSSWDRFAALSPAAAELRGSLGGPVAAVSAPDAGTVVFQLSRPFSPLLASLANPAPGSFYVLPREVTGDADASERWSFGAGPFYIDRYEPGVRLALRRNPGYEQRDVGDGGLRRPFADAVDFTIIPEGYYAGAAFEEGAVHVPATAFSAETALQLKKDMPELQLRTFIDSTPVAMWFGMSPAAPWKDQRVRQAVQYAWDRDTFIDLLYTTDRLEAVGIPVERRWSTALPGSGLFPGMWLDPQGDNFGEDARYFSLGSRAADLTEARRLLSAAGHANGFEFVHVQEPLHNGQQLAQDIIEGMLSQIGLRANQFREPAARGGPPGAGRRGGNWPELLNTVDTGGPDVGSYLQTRYHRRGALFGGWNSADTGASVAGDAFLNDTIDRLLTEFGHDARVELAHECQRYLARLFYYNRYPGGATSLQLAWPAVANWNVFRGYGSDGAFTYEWLDESQPPFV